MLARLLFAALVVAVPSSAGAEDPQDAEATATARLVFYRTPGWVGSAVAHVVTINGQRAAKLRSKSYTALSLPPGQYTVCILSGHLCVEPFEVMAGETHFIRDTSDARYAGGGTHEFSIYLGRVGATEGAAQSAGLKRVEPEADFR